MNKIVLALCVFVTASLLGCHNNNQTVFLDPASANFAHLGDTANYTTIQWVDSVKDFGTVPIGEKVKIVFHFINSGSKPLYIAEAKPSCGCTLADYTKSAVMPGQQGEVTAEYDSNHGTVGQQVHKTITVKCNAKNKSLSYLTFTGNTKAKS